MISGFSVVWSVRASLRCGIRAIAPWEAYLQRSMRLTRSGYCRDSGAPSSTISLEGADRLAEGRSGGIVRGRAALERTRLSAAEVEEDPAGVVDALCSKAEAAGGGAEEDPAAGGGGDAAEEEVSTGSQLLLQTQRQSQTTMKSEKSRREVIVLMLQNRRNCVGNPWLRGWLSRSRWRQQDQK
jgi:hypothetical protein